MRTDKKFTAVVRSHGKHGGFQLSFENGYTISVMFGECSYAEGQSTDGEGLMQANKAEVAVMDPDGAFVSIGRNDKVRGWMTSNDVAAMVADVSTWEG